MKKKKLSVILTRCGTEWDVEWLRLLEGIANTNAPADICLGEGGHSLSGGARFRADIFAGAEDEIEKFVLAAPRLIS